MADVEVQAGRFVPFATALGYRSFAVVFSLVAAAMTILALRDGQGDPAFLGFAWVLPVILLVLLAKLEAESRKGPPLYRATSEGLVRVHAGRTRTFPWSRFQDVIPIMTRKRRGNVWLPIRGGRGRNQVWLFAKEGLAWTFTRGVVIADVEDPRGLAERLRPFIAGASSPR